MGPRVAVEQGNVPLDVVTEFRVEGCFGTTKSAIGDVEIKVGTIGHAAKYVRHVLNRMGRNGKHAVAAFRHGETRRLLLGRRCANLSSSRRCPGLSIT